MMLAACCNLLLAAISKEEDGLLQERSKDEDGAASSKEQGEKSRPRATHAARSPGRVRRERVNDPGGDKSRPRDPDGLDRLGADRAPLIGLAPGGGWGAAALAPRRPNT